MSISQTTGFVQSRMSRLGQSGEQSDETERRRALNEANKRARARFFAAEQALDEAMRQCTAACAGKAADKWRAAIVQYETAIVTYLQAAEMLPPGAKG